MVKDSSAAAPECSLRLIVLVKNATGNPGMSPQPRDTFVAGMPK